jgi:hypothetical protein
VPENRIDPFSRRGEAERFVCFVDDRLHAATDESAIDVRCGSAR